MKKKYLTLFSLILSFALIGTILTGCKKNTTSSLVKVSLNEVTRSIFYAPMYVAISQGYFKEQGIDLELTTGEGADKTMQQVLSKSADIGFCGPEQVIYINNQGREDYPVLFGQLTQRDGAFIVSRQDDKNFKWENLKGKTVVGGRPGGVPEMAFEYALKSHGLTPGKDVNVITNIAFAATPGAFKGGTGDYATLFEPSASMLVKDKSAYIVDSVGASAGVIPYTCYFTSKSYMDKHPDIIEKFTKALYKGQLWFQNNSDADVAKEIKSFFPGTDEDLIVSVIKNYKSIDAYAPNLVLKEQDLNRLMDIIQSYKADLITQRPAFSKIVNDNFAEKAIKEVKLN